MKTEPRGLARAAREGITIWKPAGRCCKAGFLPRPGIASRLGFEFGLAFGWLLLLWLILKLARLEDPCGWDIFGTAGFISSRSSRLGFFIAFSYSSAKGSFFSPLFFDSPGDFEPTAYLFSTDGKLSAGFELGTFSSSIYELELMTSY